MTLSSQETQAVTASGGHGAGEEHRWTRGSAHLGPEAGLQLPSVTCGARVTASGTKEGTSEKFTAPIPCTL